MNEYLINGAEASLSEILEARDARAARQTQLLQEYGLPLLCVTLNMPGKIKRFALADESFISLCAFLEATLESRRMRCVKTEKIGRTAGNEAYYVVSCDASALKEVALFAENTHPLGRLLDADVLRPDGKKVSRLELSYPPRRCFLCENPAAVCARSRAHGIDKAVAYAVSKMLCFWQERRADRLSALAQRALLYEVCTTPKPGLVDRANCGAHKDMDMFTFMDSTAALGSYFRSVALVGLRRESLDDGLMPKLRPLGLLAEKAMYSATDNINTHKGAIFSLGLAVAAAGSLYAKAPRITAEQVFELCGKMAREDGGNKAGATVEAQNGFPSVINAMIKYREYIKLGHSPQKSGLAALLKLLAEVDDANVIRRGGAEAAKEMRARAKKFSEAAGELHQVEAALKALDTDFISANLSPGGCADLLALIYFAEELPNVSHET